MNMNSKEIMVNLMVEKICKYIDAGDINKIVVHDKEFDEVKKGKWIPVTNGRGGHECNNCHNYAPSWQTGEERLTDFCPYCGADMRGDK